MCPGCFCFSRRFYRWRFSGEVGGTKRCSWKSSTTPFRGSHRIFGVFGKVKQAVFLGGRECWSKWKQVVWYTYIYIYVYIYMCVCVYRVYNFICLFNRYVKFLDSNTSSSYIFLFIYIYFYLFLHSYTHTFCSHIHMYITTVIVFIVLLCVLVCWYFFNYYYSLHVCAYKKRVLFNSDAFVCQTMYQMVSLLDGRNPGLQK